MDVAERYLTPEVNLLLLVPLLLLLFLLLRILAVDEMDEPLLLPPVLELELRLFTLTLENHRLLWLSRLLLLLVMSLYFSEFVPVLLLPCLCL